MTRSVIDTNILIRALIKPLGSVAPIIVRLQEGRFQLIYSQELLDELIAKLELPRIKRKYQLTDNAITTFVNLLVELGERVQPERKVEICRDPDDNRVIEAALAGNAEFVVTGDEDLLVIGRFETIRFITPHEFLTILDERR
jgi:hypothetical protein